MLKIYMKDCTKIMMCYNFEYIKRRGTRKMKKFIEEFKTFALRGNVMVNFIIMAFILFCLMKGINRLVGLTKKEEEPAEPTTKICPYCQSEISIKASRCPHCTSVLEETNQNNPGKSSVQIMRRAF